MELVCQKIIGAILEGFDDNETPLNEINAVFNFNDYDKEKGLPDNLAVKWINPVSNKKYYVTVIISKPK